MTISPLPPRTMLSRPFEQTRWHAIVITTLFLGGGGGKYQVSRIFAPDCRKKFDVFFCKSGFAGNLHLQFSLFLYIMVRHENVMRQKGALKRRRQYIAKNHSFELLPTPPPLRVTWMTNIEVKSYLLL